ncbi:unnamed protein product [Taenia asiatica]|uniref:SUN domain-containing protein n=1 Tax=Taenia asiatica TaxID=60517 RepID=A0A158R7S8_TAEAS|nr:unnamed protein product [Taenia asiatica]
MALGSFGVDSDFFAVHITESFYRTLVQRDVKLFLEVADGKYKFTVEHGHTAKLFEAEPDLAMTDFPLVGACDDDGNWRHLGVINSRLRVAANSDSFDQLRANVIKAKESSRKTNRDLQVRNVHTATSAEYEHIDGWLSAEVSIAEKAREQHRRILEVVESAQRRRVDLEERLASIHCDKSLSEAQMRAAVATIEEETCSLLNELLGNEDLSATIPPCFGGVNSSDSRVSFSQFLRQLVEQAAPPMQ